MKYLCKRNNDPWWSWDETSYPLYRTTYKYSEYTIQKWENINQQTLDFYYVLDDYLDIIEEIRINGVLKPRFNGEIYADETQRSISFEEDRRIRVNKIQYNWDF